jgi:predicted dehydrogenase
VVGLGYWGPNLVRVLHELEEADVAAVCDLDDGSLRGVGRRYPALRLTTSFDEVLADDGIDALALATPVSTHYALAAAAIDAGKHVFVEKPMAGSVADAEDLVRRADAAGVLLMPGHTFLYSPPVNMVRDLIRSGELGEIYFISTSRVNLGLHQSDVSVIWDLGPHDFSILRYWLEENPSRVSAMVRDCVVPGTPDVAFVNLLYPSGTAAHVELSWLAPSKLRRTAVVGSRKMAVYDDTSNEPVRVFDSGVALRDPQSFGEYRLTYRSGAIVSPAVDAVEPLRLELADFCRSILEHTEPRSSAGIGLDVVRVTAAVEHAQAEALKAVHIPEASAAAR